MASPRARRRRRLRAERHQARLHGRRPPQSPLVTDAAMVRLDVYGAERALCRRAARRRRRRAGPVAHLRAGAGHLARRAARPARASCSAPSPTPTARSSSASAAPRPTCRRARRSASTSPSSRRPTAATICRARSARRRPTTARPASTAPARSACPAARATATAPKNDAGIGGCNTDDAPVRRVRRRRPLRRRRSAPSAATRAA